eukprot:43623_1
MSTKDSFQKSQTLPYEWGYCMPKPLIYPKHSNHVIISTDGYDDNPGIFKYNLVTNTMENLYKYDNTIRCSYNGHFIDDNSLFIFGGEYNSFFAFDLNTKSVQTDNRTNTILNDIMNCGYCPKAVHVSWLEINQIHIAITKAKHITHFKYDCNNKTLTKINIDIFSKLGLEYPKLIYAEYTKQLMILGLDQKDTILTCDINGNVNQNKYEWKVNNTIKMPHIVEDERGYDVVSFGDTIIVFYMADSGFYDIWCLDLLCYKWFESKHTTPKSVLYYA